MTENTATAPPDIPTVQLGDRRLCEKTADALKALRRMNESAPRLFQQGGVLVRLRFDDDAPRVELLAIDALRGELDRSALWMKSNGSFVDPPTMVVRNLLSLPGFDFPRLRAVAESPFFTQDGRLVVTPGYHAEAGVFLHLPEGLAVPPVPAVPSSQDLEKAKQLILSELLVDFPFVDQSSCAHGVSLLLPSLIRDMIDGPTPLHAIDAPMPGSGKGLLVDAISLITTGRNIDVMTEGKDSEELRKRVTAVLLAGSPFALFDNITRRLESGVLAALLTAPTWTDRILGASRMVRLPIRTTWVGTGNNLQFSREIARRSIWIRLDAKVPEPHRRDGFKHDPFTPWVRQQRHDLLWATLVLAQHWVAEGRPRFTARRLGSYESWSEVVGGILMAAEIEGFLANADPFAAHADDETATWGKFVARWWIVHRDKAVCASALYPIALETLTDTLGDGSERSQLIRLGKAMKKRRGWIFELKDSKELRLRLEEGDALDEKARERNGWQLTPLSRADVPSAESEQTTDIGTLEKALGTLKVSQGWTVSDVDPNVPIVEPAAADGLGEGEQVWTA